MFANQLAYFSPTVSLYYINIWKEEKGEIEFDIFEFKLNNKVENRYMFFTDYKEYIDLCQPELDVALSDYIFPIDPVWIFMCYQVHQILSLSSYVISPTDPYLLKQVIKTKDKPSTLKDIPDNENIDINLLVEDHNQKVNRLYPALLNEPKQEQNHILYKHTTNFIPYNNQWKQKDSQTQVSYTFNSKAKEASFPYILRNTKTMRTNKKDLIQKKIEYKLYKEAKESKDTTGMELFSQMLGVDETILNEIEKS